MPLSPQSEERLDHFDEYVKDGAELSFLDEEDLPTTITKLLLEANPEGIHVDDVRHWAQAKGWSAADVKTLALVFDAVRVALQHTQQIAR